MFYCIRPDEKFRNVEYDHKDDWNPFVSVICPKYKGHQHPKRDINIPLHIRLGRAKIGDFIKTWLSDWLITDRVAEMLQKTGFSGYRLQPVEVFGKKPDYPIWELVVTGQGGDAHPDAGIVVVEYCPYCKYTAYSSYTDGIGFIVDETHWDGSDFFTITGYSKHIIVTERVKQFIECQKFSGLYLIPSTDICWPKGVFRREAGFAAGLTEEAGDK